jgi:tryptophan-rich sensory protein
MPFIQPGTFFIGRKKKLGGLALRNIGSLAVFAALVVLAASTGIEFQPGEWYAALNKPVWTPPNAVFPIVWTILYVVIAVAGWLVWRAAGWSPAVLIWGVGLFFNGFWSYLMFGRHDIPVALADIVQLWVAIVAFIFAAWRVDRRASYLYMPYLAWVTFAGALNFAIWQTN